MLHIIIAVDEQDAELGRYFESSKNYLCDYLTQNKNYQIQVVLAANCNQAYINNLITNTQKPCVFAAYSHGAKHGLRCNNREYLDSVNILPLLNSFVYAMSCSSAAELGQSFKEQKGAFIGFNKEVKAFKDESDLQKKCIQCDNAGIYYMLANPSLPLKKGHKEMKARYIKLEEYFENEDTYNFFYAAYFRDMRDSLKFIGNENLTINDLMQ